ncbi:MAG: precorrin-6y C5,15-methyltransferase (decarboxylating) subunit CbiE [Pseudomonadota bacterium]
MVNKRKKINPWLFIYGVGADGFASLSTRDQQGLARCERLFTSARLRASLPPALQAITEVWRRPIQESIRHILARAGSKVGVLASGDPLSYGIGVQLVQQVPAHALRIIPAVGAFSLVAARMAWPLAHTVSLSLHHGNPARIIPVLAPGRQIIALTRDATTPAQVAGHLIAAGYGASRLVVWNDLGTAKERAVRGRAQTWAQKKPAPKISPLNTMAIECRRDDRPARASRVSLPPILGMTGGLPDEAFVHDGTMTKQAMRAVALARLAPLPGTVLWDIGAGCGSVAVEWCRLVRGAGTLGATAAAVAIEPRADRRAMIKANIDALVGDGVEIIAAPAPAALKGLPPPDAVFVGGGVALDGVIETAMTSLRSGGRLVAHAVTLAGQQRLMACYDQHGGRLEQFAQAAARPVGGLSALAPRMIVWHWAWEKPSSR